MEGLFIVLGLIVGVIALGTPVLALIAFLRSGETRRTVDMLQTQLKELRSELAQARVAAPATAQPAAEATRESRQVELHRAHAERRLGHRARSCSSPAARTTSWSSLYFSTEPRVKRRRRRTTCRR